jgi:glycosyltransferase involved in cell wall biosynthesis
MFTLKLASFIIVVNEFYRQYVAKLYGLDRREIFVVSNGSLVRFVSYVPPKIEGPLTVLYAGAALKTKDIARLCQAITSLRNAGLDLELNIAGSKLMELPDYVRISSQSWPNFVEDVLLNSDVGVIPYPADKLYFSYTTPAKTFDYMAAGKPVISTNLFEVGKIIKTFECGLIAKGWDEFEVCLEKLYYDRAFAKKLGENGRQAAEKHFNYELLAKALLTNIIKMFES